MVARKMAIRDLRADLSFRDIYNSGSFGRETIHFLEHQSPRRFLRVTRNCFNGARIQLRNRKLRDFDHAIMRSHRVVLYRR